MNEPTTRLEILEERGNKHALYLALVLGGLNALLLVLLIIVAHHTHFMVMVAPPPAAALLRPKTSAALPADRDTTRDRIRSGARGGSINCRPVPVRSSGRALTCGAESNTSVRNSAHAAGRQQFFRRDT
jgi:hypothetical protein